MGKSNNSMVYKLFSNLKFSKKGFTVIELIVVVFIIVLLSAILVSDFPKIKKQLALSRSAYQLAQDLRKAEDLGLSGVQTKDKNNVLITAKGYGIYISTSQSTFYLIYADIDDSKAYNNVQLCDSSVRDVNKDCTIEKIDLSQQSSSLFISSLVDDLGNSYISTSINFNPPDPTTTIAGLNASATKIGIVLSNGLSTRTVWVNKAGLINVQ